MNFTQEEVVKLALLSRIELSEEEVLRMQKTLSGILGYIEQIGDVDTSDISDVESGLLPCVRADEVRDCDARTVSRILSQFPEREDDLLVVPGVFPSRKTTDKSQE